MTRQLDELAAELRRIANRADTSNLIIDNHNVLREAADAIDSLRSRPAGGRWVPDANALAKKITDELFERDSVPGNPMPQLLGGDMCDPNYAEIWKAITEILRRESNAAMKESAK